MWARRYGQHSGSSARRDQSGESPEQAMYRELFEEVGLSRKDVRIGFDPQLVALQVTETFGALGHKAGLYRPETEVVSFAVGGQRFRYQYANQQHARV